MKPAIHNPDSLTPEQYGAKDGWRLLYAGESIPTDAEFFAVNSRRWCRSDRWDAVCEEDNTYRTRTPDPYADQPHDAVAEVIEKTKALQAALDALVTSYSALAKGGAK